MNIAQRLLIGLVQGYRLLFKPTCSAYALQALQQHGALAGGALMVGRILRCHPWCDGGCDAVPAKPPALFTRFGLTERDPTLDK